MTEEKGIRLSRLIISNYKKIDSLEINFPSPLMQGDADILLLGSKNGGGKTSVLECCSLLILAGIFGRRFNRQFERDESISDIVNLLIQASQETARIEGIFNYEDKKSTITLEISRRKGILHHIDEEDKLPFNIKGKKDSDMPRHTLSSIFSFSSEPLIIPPLLYFNSHRKVRELNPEIGMVADDYPRKISMELRIRRRNIDPISSFKLDVVNSLMGKALLFEGIDKGQSESVLSQLNSLTQRYCGGQIEKLLPLPDNTVDIRIKPINGRESFSFDGLSSGQKEIIATLFLIWKNTIDQPSIVLIDEPELHLNAEWHGDFIRQLYKLAPHNQYILATHSEEIFRSVDERHRAILMPS